MIGDQNTSPLATARAPGLLGLTLTAMSLQPTYQSVMTAMYSALNAVLGRKAVRSRNMSADHAA